MTETSPQSRLEGTPEKHQNIGDPNRTGGTNPWFRSKGQSKNFRFSRFD
jgi:hypothetical protein